MKFCTQLESVKTIDYVEHTLWLDFEGRLLDKLTRNDYSDLVILPEILVLLKQIKGQLDKENSNTSEMIIDNCPVWSLQPVFLVLNKVTMTYFSITFIFEKEIEKCVAEINGVSKEYTKLEKKFTTVKEILKATYSKK